MIGLQVNAGFGASQLVGATARTARNSTFILFEVLVETSCEFARFLIVSILVSPGITSLQHLSGTSGHGRGP